MKALSSASGAAQYHCEPNTQQQAAYYADEVVRSSWGGNGAESLGLSGTVSQEDFVRVLEGHVTDTDAHGNETDKQLGRQTADGTLAHRTGWDMTFSAPKSVSIASEVWGEADVRQAHENAVHAAMSYLEGQAAQTRVNGERVSTGNLLYAEFQHSISRDVDPQTHTHVIIANATAVEQADGSTRWYSVSNEQVMQHRTTADQVYHNELASQLRDSGFEVRLNERGHVEMAQYSQAQLEAFSSRSSAIDAALQGVVSEFGK
jgi:conjugative relaxase-like TrwC/TraI family protein